MRTSNKFIPNPPFPSCCIHVRDFKVGEEIPDQIIGNIQSSRRTLIVLSPEYIMAKWTMLEFKTAHDR